MSFDFGNTNADGSSTFETVEDADLLKLAGAGADWFCANCDGGNRAGFTHCTRCGAGQDGSPPPAPPAPLTRVIHKVPRSVRRVAQGMGALVAMCSGAFGINSYVNRDVEVQAVVAERTWTRQVRVERLEAKDVTGWKDILPEQASPPGSPELSAGLGELYNCETKQCWPRPPEDSITARVAGYAWSRTIKTRVMSSRSGSGWDDNMPSGHGSMPSSGSGGSEGVKNKSCRRKERTPEKCRNVNKKVACGTERKCRMKNKGNGFAEEVCTTSTKYCNEKERKCTPAVYDQWCTWDELYWSGGRTVVADGTNQSPRWPAFSPGRAESASRSQSYAITVEPLAGGDATSQKVPESVMKALPVGKLVYAGKSTATLVPDPLQVRGDRVDCGDGIERDVLATRDECVYELWSWEKKPLLEARGNDAAPEWPDGLLLDDGREKRHEFADVRLTWVRGDYDGERKMRIGVAEFDNWTLGTEVPVKVDSRARFLAFPEE
jgi:hypothetical protein